MDALKRKTPAAVGAAPGWFREHIVNQGDLITITAGAMWAMAGATQEILMSYHGQHVVSSGRTYGSRQQTVARESTTTAALLVWTFQNQKPDVMSTRGMFSSEQAADGDHVPQESGCGCARIARIGAIGCEIDGGGYQRAAVHPDAELVSSLIGTDWEDEGFMGNRLLVEYGRTGGRPNWDVRQYLEPVFVGGRPEIKDFGVEVVRYGSGNVRSVPVQYCPVEVYPSDEYVQMCRAEYSSWYAALVRLTAKLQRAELKKWDITGVGAMAKPWARG